MSQMSAMAKAPRVRLQFCDEDTSVSVDSDSDKENSLPLHSRVLGKLAVRQKTDAVKQLENSKIGNSRKMRGKSILKSDLQFLYPEMEIADLSDIIEDIGALDLASEGSQQPIHSDIFQSPKSIRESFGTPSGQKLGTPQSFSSPSSVAQENKRSTPLFLAVTPRFKKSPEIINLDDSLFSSTGEEGSVNESFTTPKNESSYSDFNFPGILGSSGRKPVIFHSPAAVNDDDDCFTPLSNRVKKRVLGTNFSNDQVVSEPAVRHRQVDSFSATTQLYSEPRMLVLTNGAFLRSLNDSLSFQRHPEAARFVANFRRLKGELVERLFRIFNQDVFKGNLPGSLEITWNNKLTKTAGQAFYLRETRTGVRKSRIELSVKVCDTADRTRDTLIHEMCHAYVWIAYGLRGHGKHWKYWASHANHVFPDLPLISRCHSYEIRAKYTYACTICAYKYNRHSKSLSVQRHACGRCSGKLELLVNSTRGTPRHSATPQSAQKLNSFALFVQENYSVVKKKTPGVSHKEVMQTLSSEFRRLKFD